MNDSHSLVNGLITAAGPDALITDPAAAAAQARALIDKVDTICVHADTPGAVAIARTVRATLDEIGG